MNNIKKIIVFIVSTTFIGSFAADALLLDGIQSGNIEKVREALDKGAKIFYSGPGPEGNAICIAYQQEQIAIAQYIMMRYVTLGGKTENITCWYDEQTKALYSDPIYRALIMKMTR